MIAKLPKLLAAFLATILAATIFAWFAFLRPVAQPRTNDPGWLFNHGSIGNETRQGLPYWIWRVLPEIFPEHLPGRKDGYGSLGLFWEAGEELPVGLARTQIGVVEFVSPNCAFCHQGSYRLRADEPAQLAFGGAGNNVSPQDYLRFLMRSAEDPRFTPERLMDRILAIYDMPWWERALYRHLLIPVTQKALNKQAARNAWMDSRPSWGPGRIDPFNPVKYYNLKLGDDGTIGNSDMMPLWNLKAVASARTPRPAVHWDGLSTDLAETVLAGAIGDGLTPYAHNRVKENLARFVDFARLNQPPPTPFRTNLPAGDPYRLDAAQVEAGRQIYRVQCAECHEPGEARYRTVIPATEVGTDRHRIDMWTAESARRYLNYEEGYNWGFKAFQKTNGYVATELTGLWLKGPYLHNGSVPTLRALLSEPAQRPRTFYRGYDVIDAENGGFVSQAGTPAERLGVRYDVTTPGNGNEGHLFGVGLGEAEKQNLLAYLKTL